MFFEVFNQKINENNIILNRNDKRIIDDYYSEIENTFGNIY